MTDEDETRKVRHMSTETNCCKNGAWGRYLVRVKRYPVRIKLWVLSFRHHRSRFLFAIGCMVTILGVNTALFLNSKEFINSENLNIINVLMIMSTVLSKNLNINVLMVTAMVLFYHARSLVAQANSAEMNSILRINRDLDKKFKHYRDLHKKHQNSSTPQSISNLDNAFEDVIDFLEVLAQMHNAKKFGSVSSCVAEDSLIPMIDFIVDNDIVRIKQKIDASKESVRKYIYREILEFSKKQLVRGYMEDETINKLKEIIGRRKYR